MQAQRFGWLFGATALLAANAASAQDCAKDADCGDGYVCKTAMSPGCAEAPCPADDPKCNNLPPDCAPMEYHYCEAKPCTADSDCGDTMVCFTQTYEECSGGSASAKPCPKDGQCPAPDPTPATDPVCTKHSGPSTCMERWAVPCKESADCGPGFDCKEQIFATCSGGGSAPAAGGGSAGSADGGVPANDPPPPPPQEMCTSEPSGMFSCVLKDLPCDTDDDCPSGLECTEDYSGVACTQAAPPAMASGDTPKGGSGSGSGSAGAGAPEDAGVGVDTPVDTCRDVKPTKSCMPHNYYRGGGAADSAQGANTAGGAPVDKGGSSNSDDGAAPPTAPKPTSSEHAASGSDPNADMSNGDNTMKSSGGCSVSATGDSQGMLGLLSMLGLSVLAVRRRKA